MARVIDELRQQLAEADEAVKANWLAGGDPERGRRLATDQRHIANRLAAALRADAEEGA